MVKTMIDAGLSDRMLLSHDFASTSTLWDTKSQEERDYVDSLIPGRWLFIKDYVSKRLLELGVDQGVLNKIFTENPRRFFEGC